MRVARLSLTDFRSYRELDLMLGPRVTTLVGPNGAGKTNIVEAIRYLSILGSHRVSTDVPLIRAGAAAAVVRAKVERAGRAIVVEATIALGRAKGYRLGGNTAKAREIAGLLRTVVFSPEDLDLVKGDPSGRRRFLDELCVALAPPLAGDLADYDRVVRQKTALLKGARGRGSAPATLDVWDERQAEIGARIVRARLEAVTALAPHVSAAYADLSAGGESEFAYDSPSIDAPGPRDGAEDDLARRLLEAIGKARPKELERGVCLVGPHRDDLLVTLGGMPARGYASHGESWSAALALRLGTYDLLTSASGPDSGEDGEPVLILDDVFAELDAARRRALAERVAPAQQVIVTAAVPADVPASLVGDVLFVGEGRVSRDGAAD
ncbi:MAG TPA: DNA replication/repair protein RecF [Demequinaceae bacterium]